MSREARSVTDVESAAERQIARINVAAERDYLRAVLAFLREATGGLGLGTPEVSGLERAVETVCLNVVERGFGPGDRASFDVALLRRPGHLVVVVEDQGLPFDFMTLEAGSGAGLAGASLAGLADTVRFLNRGTRGNRVEIVKRLPFPHLQASMACSSRCSSSRSAARPNAACSASTPRRSPCIRIPRRATSPSASPRWACSSVTRRRSISSRSRGSARKRVQQPCSPF